MKKKKKKKSEVDRFKDKLSELYFWTKRGTLPRSEELRKHIQMCFLILDGLDGAFRKQEGLSIFRDGS